MGSSLSDRIGTLQFEPDTNARRKLKRVFLGAVAIVAVLVLLPNTFTYVNPGYVGIVIHRAGGGVDAVPLGPGIHGRIPFATDHLTTPLRHTQRIDPGTKCCIENAGFRVTFFELMMNDE